MVFTHIKVSKDVAVSGIVFQCMQDGTPCRNAVNTGACPFCDYHVQDEYNKIHSKRTECKDSRLYRAFQYSDGSRLGRLSKHRNES